MVPLLLCGAERDTGRSVGGCGCGWGLLWYHSYCVGLNEILVGQWVGVAVGRACCDKGYHFFCVGLSKRYQQVSG